MERLIKPRKLTRTSITKLCNKIDAEFAKEIPDKHVLAVFREELLRLSNQVHTQDEAILDFMYENDAAEEDLAKEADDADIYRYRISLTGIKLDELLRNGEMDSRSVISDHATVLDRTSNNQVKRTYKLPKIEIKKFNGEVLDWLSFWSQFEKIHEDKELHNSDKFQYLAQAMVEGTRAKELVNSYPQTSDNYPKVIEALKDRFGKKKILKQVYVRELIKMIAVNVNTKENVSLTKLFDNLESHLRALESLGVTLEISSEFLFPMVESILPEIILIAWQRSTNFGKDGSNENPPKTELDFLMQFLKQEVESEQQRGLARAGFSSMYIKPQHHSNGKRNMNQQSKVPTAASLFVGEAKNCVFCEKVHASQDCGKAMDMTLKAKHDLLTAKKACHQCLKVHGSHRCRIWVKCSGCSKQHYHLLCPESVKNKIMSTSSNNVPSPSNHCNSINSIQLKQVLLKTILVQIKTKTGIKKVRVLFDDGSQQSYIKTASAVSIKCKESGKYFERNTLFGGVLTKIEERTIFQVQVESLNGDVKRNLELPDKKQITGELIKIPKGPWMDELKSKGIYINDYNSVGEDVDILIGADMIPFLVLDKSITLSCGLKAVKTIFGWTVMGPIPVQNNVICSYSLTLASDQIMDRDIKSLWDLELIGIREPAALKSQEEKDLQAQLHFNRTVTRNKDGRYCIALPWVNGIQSIPNNFEIAQKRLCNATKKLNKENNYETYEKIFKAWDDEGIIAAVAVSTENMSLMKGHFIPHHPVFKPESKTTPVRPVFDASCKIGRFPSLNECLEKGPNLIELIPRVMYRFREGKIGVLSDIRKAFQMIDVQDDDQNYLMFLWWEDQSCNKLKIFKHKRVVFGVKCSPFILGAVLNYHLDNVSISDKEVAKKLKESMYVDNSVTSVNTWEEYEKFKNASIRILADAKMELRQWEHSVMESPGISLNEDVDNSEFSSVLGMKWNKIKDTLSCSSFQEIPDQLTKRTLLASINKIFDPLGFLSPAMVYPKLILQSTWDRKIDWDDNLPKELELQFKKWCTELRYLADVEIPRNIKGKEYVEELSNIQLHVYNDASQLAYATAVFLRVETNNKVFVQLIQAKARIAPIAKSTIPRLELMGCVLGARIAKSIITSLSSQVKTFFWTDSTTALAWVLRNDEWGTFVGNRVREIIQLTNSQDWRHVPGKLNPADLPSRGCSPKDLLESRWWEGPEWLKLPQDKWPNESFTVDEEAVNAEKKKIASKSIMKNKVEVIKDLWCARRESYLLCLRSLAWINRFKTNCLNSKNKVPRISGGLSMDEVNNAEILMVRLIQQQVFPEDSDFIEGLRVSRDNNYNVYHVVTKILNRQDVGRFKQPLLLPHTHPVVDKIIEEEHKTYGHAGAQFLVAKLRERFWIIKTRKAVKRVINRCVTCRRFRATVVTVPIAPLPENRVKDAKAFEVSGVDLAGPLYLKNGNKVWIVIFTCAIYRAVHSESVEKINTEQFILALSRFIYKHGRIAVMYSDNGTNFVKAAKLFGKLNWSEIEAATNVHRIQWIFNPPASPWWGGFWERLIKTLKEYLRKILGQNKLNKVEMDTMLSFVDSLLNSRPLTYVSEDPDDLIPLTPAAFIQDNETSEFPEIVVLNDSGFRQKYKELLIMKEELRTRFRSEYLGQLVQRAKPTNNFNFEVSDLVFVVDDNKKRLEWSLAKIIELISGNDKEIRVARIKTASGELVRSLQRLIPLEVKASEIQGIENLEVVKKAVEIQKEEKIKKKSTKATPVKDDVKEIITKSGRVVKAPMRLQFN